MRILGLDYGDKTIGIAISDPFGWTAQGLEIIKRINENEYKKSISRIAEIVLEFDVEKIVLGFPKNMDNSEGLRCEKTLEFKNRLEKRFNNIPIILWDERMSTIAAQRSLIEGNMSRIKRKNIIDKIAAIYILQGFLDKYSK